jgi:hypothetical protein|tara:strand:- start:3703 stop:4629 length:927 start_codon:yes stop_codon:yes gene_type:complete
MKASLQQIKDIFGNKKNALDFVRHYHPHTFTKKTTRSRKETFNRRCDVYEYIKIYSQVSTFRSWVFDFCTTKGGKFYEFHSDYKRYVNKYNELQKERTKLQVELNTEDVCFPDNFSNDVTKPMIRKALYSVCLADQNSLRQLHLKYADLHWFDRQIAQLKNDLAEYKLLIELENYIPTLKHKAGNDAYLIDASGKLKDLDIKTSRWPKFFVDGETRAEAATKLYQKQGAERYSENSRLYLVLPSNNGYKPKDNLSIKAQLDLAFDVTFTHSDKKIREQYGKDRLVRDVRLIFLDDVFIKTPVNSSLAT